LTSQLDCTGGWTENLEWQGLPVGQLLDQVGVQEGATLVRFVSATGHFAELPLAEAEAALLATHVGGVVLSPEHGFPLRLVAPARRGFQWTKWLTSIEVV
jgi:DMSO/TMAO reductase YedYZ molybdopterin-dependent catalytic subunit